MIKEEEEVCRLRETWEELKQQYPSIALNVALITMTAQLKYRYPSTQPTQSKYRYPSTQPTQSLMDPIFGLKIGPKFEDYFLKLGVLS